MKCLQCPNDMIQTRATNLGDDYWYCRTCKKELAEMQVKWVPLARPSASQQALGSVYSPLFLENKLVQEGDEVYGKLSGLIYLVDSIDHYAKVITLSNARNGLYWDNTYADFVKSFTFAVPTAGPASASGSSSQAC